MTAGSAYELGHIGDLKYGCVIVSELRDFFVRRGAEDRRRIDHMAEIVETSEYQLAAQG